ncbi:MAG: deoxyhypusine synthase family protein, partial [Candidatus Methanomethyliaceae archaeon]|nr:deoxyhypusine synthase family protein [Candidatus Methanomethyliaceae archaeon]
MKYFKKKIEEIDLTPEKLKLREELLSNPVIQLDLEKIKTIRDLVEGWQHCGIQSRNLAECAMVYENMLLDEDRPIIFLGLAGALIAGGLRKVISDMICKGIVDVIVSTGAILYQDYYISQGYKHYKGSPNANDELLRDLYIDRIYDAYIDEIGFIACDEKIAEFCSGLEPRKYSTREFLYLLGSTLKDEESILYNAYKFEVPIFCPAIA